MTRDAAQAEVELFQGVRCGSLRVAFAYGWSTAIVENFSLTPIPKAPSWLVGAANIDGRIFPVIDLSNYGATGARATRSSSLVSDNLKNKRLLIGGNNAGNDDYRFAVIFDGLPQQLRRESVEPKSPDEAHSDASPSHTIEGLLRSAQGERYAMVNIEQLVERLSAELSTL
jgi:chemotaxis signal transduction protein